MTAGWVTDVAGLQMEMLMRGLVLPRRDRVGPTSGQIERAARNRRMMADLEAGEPLAVVADRYGLTPATVRQYARDRDVSIPLAQQDLARARRDAWIAGERRRGRTLDSIAQDVGLTREAVRLIAAVQGVSPEEVRYRQTDRRRERLLRRYEQDPEATLWELVRHGRERAFVLETLGPERVEILRERGRQRQRDKPGSAVRTTDDVMLDDLRRCAEELGRSPSAQAFDRWYGGYRAQLYYRRFGSWLAAMEAAGLPPAAGRRREYPQTFSREDCMAAASRCAEELGQPYCPGASAYDLWSRGRADVPSCATVRRLFGGSWKTLRAEYDRTYEGGLNA